jgi:hypothetical protein
VKSLLLAAAIAATCALLSSCFISPCSGCAKKKHVNIEYVPAEPER